MQSYWNYAESLDRTGLVRLQERRLKSLLEYMDAKSPYYRKRFQECGLRLEHYRGLEDLQRLPCTSKQDITGDLSPTPSPVFYQHLVLDTPESILRWHRTSGTTGVPVRIGDTLWDWCAYGDMSAAALYGMGVRRHDTVVIPFGYGPFIAFWAYMAGVEKIGSTFVPSGGLTSEARIALLQEFGATVLLVTPSYGLHLAEVAQNLGVDLAQETAVRLVITTGEPISAAAKARLEAAWGAQTRDRIGSAETGGIAFECPSCRGVYHIQEDFVIPEVIDETGRPVPHGEEGELVITPLYRRGMPLLRLRTGNIVRLSERTKHNCHRHFLSLAETENGVVVRRTDMLVKVRGVLLDPITIERTIRQFSECGEGFQVVLEKVQELDEASVRVESKQPLADDARGGLVRRLQDALRMSLGLRLNVEVVPLGSLKLDGNKIKRVVDLRGKRG